MPPSATDQQEQYSGKFMSDLYAQVVQAEQQLFNLLAESVSNEVREQETPFSAQWWVVGEVRAAEMVIRARRDPWAVLNRAWKHIGAVCLGLE